MTDVYYLQGQKRNIPEGFLPKDMIFDANIWLSINGPFEDKIPSRAQAYTRLYKKAIEAESSIYVPQIIATEFINKSIMILAQADGFSRDCKIHQAKGYEKWIKEGCDLLHSIIDGNKRISDNFDKIDLEECNTSAEKGGIEFHDVIISSMCIKNDFVLVTDDADYSGQDITVLTWNQKLK